MIRPIMWSSIAVGPSENGMSNVEATADVEEEANTNVLPPTGSTNDLPQVKNDEQLQ